jgi:hypothetical protein
MGTSSQTFELINFAKHDWSRGKDDVWCWDFIHGQTISGGPLKSRTAVPTSNRNSGIASDEYPQPTTKPTTTATEVWITNAAVHSVWPDALQASTLCSPQAAPINEVNKISHP